MPHSRDMQAYAQVAGALALGVAGLYILLKLAREGLHRLFPSYIPGEPNTALLASPRPKVGEVFAKDLENVREYDYVIIGTGTAGCVLANRLTEDAGSTVLAIEAGHSDLKQLFSRIPAGFGRLFGTAADWNFYTEKDAGCNGRKLYWPRGKMLGGCSSINAMIYNKGAPADYDEWEALGNKGWAYKTVSKYMKKCETFDHSERSALTQTEISEHGNSGPWKTGYSHLAPLSKLFIEACQAVGISATPDWNTSKGMVGASQFQTFIDPQGQRSSTAVAYLTENVARRPNLSIATGQTVTKIIFDNSSGKPRAVGVEMAASSVSPVRYIVKAKKEVILAAGAIGTPHVLKLSGVGPSSELKQHGIPVVKDSPGVGANLADHLCGIVCFETKAKSMQYLFHPTKSLPALIEWIRFGKGAMTSNAAESGAFIRVADREDAPESLKKKDLSAGPGSVDLELLIGPLSYIEHGKQIAPMDRDFFSVGPIMLRPESRAPSLSNLPIPSMRRSSTPTTSPPSTTVT